MQLRLTKTFETGMYSGNSFQYMFDGARSFNQDIGDWDVSNGTSFANMFSDIFDVGSSLTKI